MGGALDRSKSPTSSEGSKENRETSDLEGGALDSNGNTVKYPCPDCKKGFSKVGNVYKHMKEQHGRSSEEYTKLRREILASAYVAGGAGGAVPDREKALQLAVAVGLVDRVGVKPRGRPPKQPATLVHQQQQQQTVQQVSN